MYTSLMELVDRMLGLKVMIVGDLVADVYLEGKIARISREAPVLILEHAGELIVPGGAANAVHNAATLGGQVYAVGVVGQDSSGIELVRILKDKGVVVEGIVTTNTRSTITKTRVMAGGQATVRQQVVRIDRESKESLHSQVEQVLLAYIQTTISSMDVVILSDYGSGTITPIIREKIINQCRIIDIPCIVDSRYDVMAFKGITVVKQNESEAATALGYESLNGNNLGAAGQAILERLDAQAVLITRGPDGMVLFDSSGKANHIPVTNKSEVYDVTGAGDTVVAAMSLALAAGASYLDAARLANFAAGIVVKKPGTATTNPQELKETLGVYNEIYRSASNTTVS